MKHFYTLLFSVLFSLSSVFAADEQSFNFLNAISLEHTGNLVSGDDGIKAKKGDFCFELTRKDNDTETVVAQLFVSTASQTVNYLAGAYRIGAIGVYSYIYDENGNSTRLASGALMLECVGDTTTTIDETKTLTLPLYRIRLIDAKTTEGETVSFEANRIPAFGMDKQYYEEYRNDNTQHLDDWYFIPLDRQVQAENLDLVLYQTINRTKNDGVWLVQGLDPEDVLEGYAVVLVGASKSILGAEPSVLTVGNNGAPLTCIYKGAESITVEGGYGVVYLNQQADTIFDFYLKGTNATYYHVMMQSYPRYDNSFDTNEDFSHVYTSAYIHALKNEVSISVADDETAGEIVFYVNELDPDLVLPEGEYTVSADCEPWQVKASYGVDLATSYLDPTYFAVLVDGAADEMTFLTQGIVNVTHNDRQLLIQINGTNSNEKKIEVTIDLLVTDLEDTAIEHNAQPSRKIMEENGRIIILHNGNRYDMQGQMLP